MRSVHRCIALAVSIALAAPPVLLSVPSPAWAQPKAPKKKSIRDELPLEARGHWDAGVALAERNNWDGARTSFKAAYEMSKNPRVLFNIAVSERQLNRYASALGLFKEELSEGAGRLPADEESEVKQAIAGLEKLVAHLTIAASEPGVEVFVDEEKIDPAKLPGPITVDLGKRRVRAVKPGFAEASETIDLAGGADGKVTLELKPLVKTTRVNVSVVGPPSAMVRIDGKEVGPAPYAGLVNVTGQPSEFSAEATGYVGASQSVIVKEGEPLNLMLQLAPEQAKGKLLVLAKPAGATIEIDGATVGATRWEGPVDARVHQIVVKKPGFYTWTYDVDVPKGGSRSVSASLNEDRNTSFVPWLIGSIVVGAAITVGVVLLATPPDEKPVDGTLPPFKIGTQGGAPGFRF